MLAEVRARVAPSRSLVLTPSGAGVEPLGALRRAFTHVAGSEPLGLPPPLHEPLGRRLEGEGTALAVAATLLGAYLSGKTPAPPGRAAALLIDDALDMEAPSLEAC